MTAASAFAETSSFTAVSADKSADKAGKYFARRAAPYVCHSLNQKILNIFSVY